MRAQTGLWKEHIGAPRILRHASSLFIGLDGNVYGHADEGSLIMPSKGDGGETPDAQALGFLKRRSNPTSARGAVTRDGRHPPLAKETREADRAPQDRRADSAISPANEQQGENQSGHDRPRGRGHLRALAVVTGAILFLAVAAAGYIYWDYARRFESTDDAFIQARQFAVAPKVSGYITAVPVTDNQHVAAGQVIARIDDRDYHIALEQAQAQVSAAEASIQNIDAQLAVQQAQIAQNQAQLEQAQASLMFAQQQAQRYEDLAQKGAGSVQNAQQYRSGLQQQDAAVKTAQAALVAAQRQISALKAQRASAEASLGQADAQRDQAQLNLSYTNVTAAQSGRVANLTAAVGQFAQAGTSLTMFVPDEIWVAANFKETQLDAMRPGQPATMRIDAYPERAIRGHVASIQPGSGTAFSLLPAENATGNYVKIVQRVPVKLVIDDPPTDVALGPGMSVVPSVRVEAAPSLYERLAAFFERRKGPS
jgi:membrane fusion protein, multidrug efflux system